MNVELLITTDSIGARQAVSDIRFFPLDATAGYVSEARDLTRPSNR